MRRISTLGGLLVAALALTVSGALAMSGHLSGHLIVHAKHPSRAPRPTNRSSGTKTKQSTHRTTSSSTGSAYTAISGPTSTAQGTTAATKSSAVAAASAAGASAAAGVLLGDQQIEATVDTNGAGSAEAFPFTAQSGGTATSIAVYVDSHNHATTLAAGLYSDNNGHPGSLLVSGLHSDPKAGAWTTITLNSSSILAGQTYWVAILGRGGTLAFRDRDNGSCTSESSRSSSLTALPSSWSTGATWRTCPVSAYVNGLVPAATANPPSNTTSPAISGSTVENQTLTTTSGSWSGSPTAYIYSWHDCDSSGANCTTISGASSSRYTLTASDVGHTIRSAVVASNSTGVGLGISNATSVVSAPVQQTPPPAVTSDPTVSGSTVQGQTLTGTRGTWSGSPTSYSYVWADCDSSGASCAGISGANSATYVLGSRDVGHTIRVVVIATNAGGSTLSDSSPTAVVTSGSSGGGGGGGGGGAGAPANTALPTVHGYATPGSELMANDPGTWTNSPTSYTYQWQDCTSSGCTNATNTSGLSGDPCSPTAFCYVASSAEASAGDTIKVVVTAHNSAGTGQATAAAAGPASTSSPVNCALTQAAGRDGLHDNNDGSCWGTHTGITGATGCTEAQLLAQSPAMCAPPYFTTITSDQSYSSANKVVANAIIKGCVGVQAGAGNFHMRDSLVYSNSQNCENTSSDAQTSTWGDGNTQSVPGGVVLEDTEVDGMSVNLEVNPVLNDFGVILGAGGTCLRCNIHGFAKDITVNGLSGRTTTVEDSFIHDPPVPVNDSRDCTGAGGDHFDPHSDPFWADSASYVTAEHDYISGAGGGDCVTAALSFLSDYGAPANDVVNDTFMDGGTNPGGGRPDAYFGKSGSCAVSTHVTADAFSNDTVSGAAVMEWNPGGSNVWSGNYTPETSASFGAPNNC